jgi:CRP-like cAMP-binding protein
MRVARAREFDWVGCLPETAREAVLAEMTRIVLPAGRMIYERDAPPTGIYRVVRGRVRMFFLAGSGRMGTIRFYKPTDTVGDLAAIDGKPRLLFAETTTECEFQFLPIERMKALRAAYPAIDATLVLNLAHSLRLSLLLIESLTNHSLASRVAMRLDWLAREDAPGVVKDIDIAISQADLAQMVGASRQATNKVLGDLQKCGALDVGYGSLRVLDLEILNDFMRQAQEIVAED